jgi:hypothetical protein
MVNQVSTTAEAQRKIEVKLPDGSTRDVVAGSTLMDLARDIGPGLAKAALGGKINGQLVDLSTPITEPAEVQLVTWKDDEGREMFRHTSTHIMAQALKRILPDSKLTIGPPLADSYYYDFDVKEPLTPEMLEKIEAEMDRIVQEGALRCRVKTLSSCSRKRASRISWRSLMLCLRTPPSHATSRASSSICAADHTFRIHRISSQRSF